MATQAFKLPRFQAGQSLLTQLTAKRLNAMLDAIEANRVLFGANVTGQFSTAGTTISADPPDPSLPDEQTYAFKMENASNFGGTPSYKVLIFDGLVNDVAPDGMGNDDFRLTIGGDGYKVYLIITVDPTNLAILSRSITQAVSVPVSTISPSLITLYILIGSITIEDDTGPGTGKLTPHNELTEDVRLDFIYGAINATPGIWNPYTGWLVIP